MAIEARGALRPITVCALCPFELSPFSLLFFIYKIISISFHFVQRVLFDLSGCAFLPSQPHLVSE